MCEYYYIFWLITSLVIIIPLVVMALGINDIVKELRRSTTLTEEARRRRQKILP
jgi:hypothetical protein